MMTRSLEHDSNMTRKDSSSAMWRHSHDKHQGALDVPWSMETISQHRDPLSRVIAEGVHTNHLDPEARVISTFVGGLYLVLALVLD